MQIEISRWTVMELEKAIYKYNKIKEHYTIHDYQDMINKLLEGYNKK